MLCFRLCTGGFDTTGCAAIEVHEDKLTQDHKGTADGRFEADLRPDDFGAACEAALGGDAHPSLC